MMPCKECGSPARTVAMGARGLGWCIVIPRRKRACWLHRNPQRRPCGGGLVNLCRSGLAPRAEAIAMWNRMQE